MHDFNSVINLREGYINGVNPNIFPTSNCFSSPVSYIHNGPGKINDFTQDIYIQNETISTNKYYAGKNIYVGYDVTTSKPYGNVYINNNSKVILDANQNIFIYKNVEISPNSEIITIEK